MRYVNRETQRNKTELQKNKYGNLLRAFLEYKTTESKNMPMCCPAHSFHSVRLAQQGSRDSGQQPGAGLLKVRSPQRGQQTESTFTSVSGKPQCWRSRWSQLRPPFSRGFPAAVIRTPRQSLDNLASFSLLHPLATDKRCLWTTLADRLSSDERVFCHALVDFFPHQTSFLPFHISMWQRGTI